MRRTGAIGPIDAIQPLPFGALDPVGDRGDTDAEPASDGTQRLASGVSEEKVSGPFCERVLTPFLRELHRRLVTSGVDLVALAVKTDNLEDIYMKISRHRTS